MEARLNRVGDGPQSWRLGRQPFVNGEPMDLGDGWTAAVLCQGKRNEVEVFLNGQSQYVCNISRASVVWLLEQGAAAPAKEGPAHMKLAKLAIAALAMRRAGPGVLAKVSILRPYETVNGVTFRTTPNARNHFTDGHFRVLSDVHSRVTKQCIGGTYLVTVTRHDNSSIFAVDILVRHNYDAARLQQCLCHLA